MVPNDWKLIIASSTVTFLFLTFADVGELAPEEKQRKVNNNKPVWQHPSGQSRRMGHCPS